MKFELTNPKAWKAVNEKNMPMKHKIKVYEKLGGAYRFGEDGGEQVYNKMTELLKSKMGINEGPETKDHEVSMAGGQLDDIINFFSKAASNKTFGKPSYFEDKTNKSAFLSIGKGLS